MISMELSGVQRNAEVSAEHAAAIARFLASGGNIQVINGYVHKPVEPAKPYGRATSVDLSTTDEPKPKRQAWNKGVQVSRTMKDRVKQLALTMTMAEAQKETGLSLYVLKRVASDGGFDFQPWDPRTNIVRRQIDPIADALNVVRIKEACAQGLSQKAAVKALSISNTLMKRLIHDYSIEYPLKRTNR